MALSIQHPMKPAQPVFNHRRRRPASPEATIMSVAEIAIHGYTVGRATAHLCGPPFFNATAPRHFAEDIIEQIDAAEAAGATVLFVSIDSLGGESGPGLDIYERMRRFSQERGPVVTYVKEAGSTAVFLALAGDIVFMDPASRFVVHSCWGDQPTRDTWNEYLGLLMESRGLAPYWRVRSFMVESPQTGERHNAVIVDPAFAVHLGWCDLVADLESARGFAEQVARAGIPAGLPRHAALATRKPLSVERPTFSASGSIDVVKLTDSQKDRDNLWFNPSSEIAPQSGADTTQAEWADRYNAGAGAYSGSWVRRMSIATPTGFWVPCSPGALFYFSAQMKRESGAGSGGRLQIEFYPTLGTRTGVLATAYSSSVTSASWTLAEVTSAAAPAGTNAAFIGYSSPTGDVIQLDALYARRVAQPEMIASEVLSVTWGTGWTTTPITYLRRSAGLVVGDMGVTAAAGAAWTSIFTLPVGARPLSNVHVHGLVAQASSGLSYVGRFLIDTNGVCQLGLYDNGTSLVAPFAIGVGDLISLNFAFPWV